MSQQITVAYDSSPSRLLDLPDDFLDGADVSSVVKLMVKRDLDLPDTEAFFDLEAVLALDADGALTVTLNFTPAETALPEGTWPGALRIWKDGDDTHEPDDSEAVELEVTAGVDLP